MRLLVLNANTSEFVTRRVADAVATLPEGSGIDEEALKLAILAPALVVVFLAMLGVTTFQTRMAQDQVELDRLELKVDKAEALHQVLARQQAELRSPVRLGRAAGTMHLAPTDAVGFIEVDPQTLTKVLSTSGRLPIGESGTAP